ncbi:hypothetical protein [Alicyclobacillus mengziensis]|uniref:Uncharacterized protein n=1 Tax=Alicyclobacillus mengziensis TaxID=2931921 RepID=A0A9X7VZI5_9BACL|nr:hypothetical protein [Alicyclobacillus mengziensis]QSO47352.1 hypothetical protein JZ786_23690 [Alicyclobacillus mengziensis]
MRKWLSFMVVVIVIILGLGIWDVYSRNATYADASQAIKSSLPIVVKQEEQSGPWDVFQESTGAKVKVIATTNHLVSQNMKKNLAASLTNDPSMPPFKITDLQVDLASNQPTYSLHVIVDVTLPGFLGFQRHVSFGDIVQFKPISGQ